jgi:Flp pilus assembly protein CpaB
MNRTWQFVIGLVSLVLAVGAGFYGRNEYLKEVSTIQVPVPARSIPPYTLLTSDLFTQREMPRAIQTLPYYLNAKDLVGKISTVALPSGLPVSQENAVAPNSFRLADAAFEVVSIPVDPVSAVGGQIHIGQRVNLYTMTDKVPMASVSHNQATASGKPDLHVEQIAASVLIVDIRSSQGLPADALDAQKTETTTFTGRDTVEQAQILTLALPPDKVQDVLMAIAGAKKQGGLLWTTLALP